MEHGIHVVLAAEQLGTLWGIPITNTLIMSWIVVALLSCLAIIVGRSPCLIPGNVQLVLEEIVEGVHSFMKATLENDAIARRYLPLLLTIFLFIATANILEFIPGVGSLIYNNGTEYVPFLRSMNTDLNVTLTLAIIAVIVVEVAGVMALGVFRYAGKFVNFRGHSIGERMLNFVVGLIELISEVARLVSFSFRLFGNIFAGEVLLAVASFFIPYVIPSSLMVFELFIGILQGGVFALLTLFFIKMAVTPMEGH